MLAKKYRLPASIRLESISVISTPFFTARIAKNVLSHNRYGFIVTKKIDKRAAVRNRIKRRVRAAVEIINNEQRYHHRDVLFLVKKEALQSNAKALHEEVKHVFEEIMV